MPYRRARLHNFFYLSSAYELTRLSAVDGLNSDQKIACVLGAIAASVAFLECSVNGLYEHAANKFGRMTSYRRLLGSVFHEKMRFAYLPWLTKYQVALALAHKPTFKIAEEPYQSAELLNHLRNELIHPKEIFPGLGKPFGSEVAKSMLEKKLQGRFKFNPKRAPEGEGEEVGDEFIPQRCLTPSCAAWAVRTAAEFYGEFENRIPPTAYFLYVSGNARLILKELKKLPIP